MHQVFLNRMQRPVDFSAQALQRLTRYEVPGAIDRNKLQVAAAALKLASLKTNTPKVMSLGNLDRHFADLASEIAPIMGMSPAVKACQIGEVLDVLSEFVPDVLFFSVPSESFAFFEILESIAQRMTAGASIYFTNYSNITLKDVVLPARAAGERLEDLGFEPLEISYYALYRKPLVPRPARPPRLSPAEQARCVHVVGHARSGTSVLCHALNEQTDILQTYEANWFLPRNRLCPVEQYNLQRTRWSGRPVRKSFVLPEHLPANIDIRDLYRANLETFHYFGDKIAVGVRENHWEAQPVEEMIAYQMAEFPWSNYLLCIRDPLSALAAQKKITPDRTSGELMTWWLTATTRFFDLFMTLDRCVVLPFPRLSTGDLRPAENLLGRSLASANIAFKDSEITTKGPAIGAYFSAEPKDHRDLAETAHRHYVSLIGMIDEATGRPRAGVTREAFIDVLTELRRLL